MKKRYTKKQIMESIKYWQKQLKAINESSWFKEYFNGEDIDLTDEQMDDWFENFCKDASLGKNNLYFEKGMFNIMLNNVVDTVDNNSISRLLNVCKQYVACKEKLIDLMVQICKICGENEIFDDPSDDVVSKNGGVYYGGIAKK